VERRFQDEQQRERLDQLQEQLRQPQQPLIEGQPVLPKPGDEATPEPTQALPIQGVNWEGTNLPPLKILEELRERFIGQPGSQATLGQLRLDLVQAFEQAHLLAQVGQPQLGPDGVVRLPVVVARLGAVQVVDDQGPIRPGWAIATVNDAVGIGRELRLDKLESALLKLNDLGGLQASARLQAGERPGTTNVLLTLNTTRQVQGEVALNNHTTKYTGPYQAQASAAFNGLLGRGEVASLNGSYSGDPFTWGSRSAGFNLNWPLTPGGLSAVASVNWSDYRLLDQFQSDDYTGSFLGGSLGLSQVVWRRPTKNLSWRISADANHFNDSVLGFEYSNRSSWAGRFALLGDIQDRWLGLGINSGIFTLSVGTLSLDGPDEAVIDALAADKAGPWGKLNLLLNRYQMFRNSPWSLELLAQGQLAFTNLDSVEKMSLGWPNGVRAYPPGEGFGDSGVAGQFTARYQLARNLVAKGFVDGGYIWRWTNPFNGSLNPNSNSFGLWGPGIGLEWGTRGDVLASVDVAWPLGNNPNTPTGVDVDGSDADVRVWVSLRKWL
jgi:hemolysin activation/secretion protein